MKQCAYRLLLTAFIFTFSLAAKSQQKNNSLLWRIQKGNGKPSFLFGTMHVSDKKAFNFKDSLYTYLQNAEAFALEFNPDSANQIIAAYMSGEFETPGYQEDDYLVSPVADTAIFTDTSVYITDVPAPPPAIDTLLAADTSIIMEPVISDKPGFIEQFSHRISENAEKELESMATFMDAYLYEMARQKDKKIFGLETMKGKDNAVRALSEGFKPKFGDSLFQKWSLLNTEQVMNRLYLNEDLDSLELFYTELYDETALDIFLFRRNREMVVSMKRIMDSQSLFAAVGAAHLPGEKGMIAMLRKEGYKVEPVFSTKRIAAASMQLDLKRHNWKTIKKPEYGFGFRLPGIAKSQDGGDGRKVVYHYDIGAGTLFMTVFGSVPASDRGKGFQDIVTAHLDARLAELGGRTLSRKTIDIDGTKAIEALCLYAGNGYYRYREIVKDNIYYIFSLTSEKKENVFSENAEDYLSSLEWMEVPKATWPLYESPADGFSIRFPNRPEAPEPIGTAEPGATTTTTSYTYFDAATNTKFAASATRTVAGQVFYQGESFFYQYTNYFSEMYSEEPVVTDSIVDGYPAKFFDGKTATGGYRSFVVKRGNTSYYVAAEYEDSTASAAVISRFLSSFRTSVFARPEWTLQTAPAGEFSAWLPGKLVLDQKDSTAYDYKPGVQQYYGHDPYAATSYDIVVSPITKYFWSVHIDSLYNFWRSKLVNKWSDSLVYEKVIKTGNLEGREICKVTKWDKERTIIHMVLNGDRMYVLSAVYPYQYADESNINRFFSDFRLHSEASSSQVFNNGPAMLFADLQSTDSATFYAAYNALDEVHFDKEDILLLLEKALATYPLDTDNVNSVRSRLLANASVIFSINGSPRFRDSVIEFVKARYNDSNKAIDSARFSLLGMIAADKRETTYKVLADLLGQGKHGTGYPYQFFGKLYDSLQLTRTLYPAILKYASDTITGLDLAGLTKTLLDSNLLVNDDILPAKNGFLKLSHHVLKKVARPGYEDAYAACNLVELLGLLKQRACDEMVRMFLNGNDNNIKMAAAMTMLKNKQSVPASVLRIIAGDAQYRAQLFADLEKYNKGKLFPADHRSQVSMAESYIFTAIYDETEDETKPELVYIKKITYRYRGEQKVFYIYRANYDFSGNDEEAVSPGNNATSYFTVAGPFDTDPSVLTIDEKENISGMWYQEQFDGEKNDYFFTKYIEQRLKWRNEKK